MDTEPVGGIAAEAPVSDTVTFYGEEPKPEGEPKAEEESAEALAGEEIKPSEALAGPALEALGAAPTPPPAPGKPPAPAGPPSELSQLQQLAYQQQLYIDQQRAALAQIQAQDQERQLRVALEGQGYNEEQIASALTQHGQLRQQQEALAQQAQALQQQGQRIDMGARAVVIQNLSAMYGIPPAQLQGLNDPYVMEERAKNFQLQQENAQLKQKQVKPQKMASVGPGQQASASRSRLLDLYNAGKDLTPEQEGILFGHR